jgi:error-prone DNA polymerase
MKAYAELQCATNFSFLRGASQPAELAVTAKALGLTALAVTDRNSLAGVVQAHIKAKEVGLRFILGCRLDFADGSPSVLCYPTDREAYGRLTRLLTVGQMRAKKGECELLWGDLVEHGEGQLIIVVPPDVLDDVFAAQLDRMAGDLRAGSGSPRRGPTRPRTSSGSSAWAPSARPPVRPWWRWAMSSTTPPSAARCRT